MTTRPVVVQPERPGIVRTMSDRRYSTAAWQRLRRQVLARDGYVCRIQGPRCRGRATTVHHVLPSSQYPELFWAPDNLEAACGACNYAGGAQINTENRKSRIAQLEELVVEQHNEIARLIDRLATYENGPATEAARPRRCRRFPSRVRRSRHPLRQVEYSCQVSLVALVGVDDQEVCGWKETPRIRELSPAWHAVFQMRRIRRLGAVVFAICAFTVSVAPAALADAGGGPGSNHGCPGNQPPPPPAGGCHH
jgi:5-methylcytosine-specific restriction endonuclease McrA